MSCDLNLSIVGTLHSCSRAVLGFRFPVWQVVLFLFGVVVTAVDCLVWNVLQVSRRLLGVLYMELFVCLSSWTFCVVWMTGSDKLWCIEVCIVVMLYS